MPRKRATPNKDDVVRKPKRPSRAKVVPQPTPISFETFLAEQRALNVKRLERKNQLEALLAQPATTLEARRLRLSWMAEHESLHLCDTFEQRTEAFLNFLKSIEPPVGDAQRLALFRTDVLRETGGDPSCAFVSLAAGATAEVEPGPCSGSVVPALLPIESIDVDRCPKCASFFVHASEPSMLYCEECAYAIPFVDAACATNMNYGDDTECSSSAYRRVNHLNERLNHFQAKESTVLLAPVVEQILEQIRTAGLSNSGSITLRHVKQALKDCGLRKYYDQTMQIWCDITGRMPIRLEPVFLEKVHLMFRHIQAPFKKHCPEERRNFLSYPYLLFKASQLLGYTHLLPYYQLLKGDDKLHAQESIFEKICLDLNWNFVPIPPEYIPTAAKKTSAKV